jgi:hypothetical protein
MGEPDAFRVDIPVLLDVARGYDSVADLVDSVVRNQLGGLSFDGAIAGREHAASGDALRWALEGLIDQLSQWSRACAEVGAVLRSSADRHLDADTVAAGRLG